MSIYVRLRNGKVIEEQQGAPLVGEGVVEVSVVNNLPIDYPSNFYAATSNKPRRTIVDNTVTDTTSYVLKSVEAIKQEIYALQKVERQIKQLGSFMVGELEVTLKDREDSLIISSLAEADTRYKVAQGQWITLTAPEVAALKEAHRLHVQAAYDWEMNANAEIDLLVTHDDIKAYLDATSA